MLICALCCVLYVFVVALCFVCRGLFWFAMLCLCFFGFDCMHGVLCVFVVCGVLVVVMCVCVVVLCVCVGVCFVISHQF